jgi:hypothetical protein
MTSIKVRMKVILIFLWHWIIPEFVTEDVAANKSQSGGWDLRYPIKYVLPHENYDSMVSVRYLRIFGRCLFVNINSDFRPFKNPWAGIDIGKVMQEIK